jgi:NAD(P)-dependent dehydrogenase (short-subunit alcohol dehydrogenase family)
MARRDLGPHRSAKEKDKAMKHVLITGAAQRVGRVMALTLAESGWDVTLHYRNSATEAETLANNIRALGRNVFLVRADLEKPEEVETIFPALCAPLTALINNASLFEPNASDPDGTRHHQINFEAPVRLTQLMREQCVEGEDSSVLHILDGTKPPPFLSSYTESRKALALALPEQARAFAPYLRVNGLALGPTLRNPRESTEHFDSLIAATPLKRATTPQEVARAALLLLASPAITGEILPVDGGHHLLA